MIEHLLAIHQEVRELVEQEFAASEDTPGYFVTSIEGTSRADYRAVLGKGPMDTPHPEYILAFATISFRVEMTQPPGLRGIECMVHLLSDGSLRITTQKYVKWGRP